MDHPVIEAVAREIELAKERGDADPEANAFNCAVFFLLGLYALLTTTHGWPDQSAMLDDYVATTLRGMAAR